MAMSLKPFLPLFISITFFWGCDPESPPRKKTTAPAAPTNNATPAAPIVKQPPLPQPPEMPQRSVFQDELTTMDSFPAAEGPESLTLRWKLDPTSKHTLAYQEKTETRMDSPNNAPKMRNELEGHYTLEGSTLTLNITRGSLTPLMDPSASPVELSPEELTTLSVEGFTARGRIKTEDNRNPFMSFLLPEAELKRGQPLKHTESHPFTFYDTPTLVKGELTSTLLGYVEIQDIPCGWVHITGKYTELEVPKDKQQEGKIITIVNTNLCFDFTGGRLLFAESASRQAVWLYNPIEPGFENLYLDADTHLSLSPIKGHAPKLVKDELMPKSNTPPTPEGGAKTDAAP